MRQPTLMQNSSYREATDMRLSPSDSLYVIVHRKIRENQIELGDFEKFSNNDIKETFMSVSGKSPTSSALHPNYSKRAPPKG